MFIALTMIVTQSASAQSFALSEPSEPDDLAAPETESPEKTNPTSTFGKTESDLPLTTGGGEVHGVDSHKDMFRAPQDNDYQICIGTAGVYDSGGARWGTIWAEQTSPGVTEHLFVADPSLDTLFGSFVYEHLGSPNSTQQFINDLSAFDADWDINPYRGMPHVYKSPGPEEGDVVFYSESALEDISFHRFTLYQPGSTLPTGTMLREVHTPAGQDPWVIDHWVFYKDLFDTNKQQVTKAFQCLREEGDAMIAEAPEPGSFTLGGELTTATFFESQFPFFPFAWYGRASYALSGLDGSDAVLP